MAVDLWVPRRRTASGFIGFQCRSESDTGPLGAPSDDSGLLRPQTPAEGEDALSVNLSVVPLPDARQSGPGCMLMIEDLTQEKRLKTTMARYMTKEVVDKLLEEGEDALGGKVLHATVLFTDIRGFTSIAEALGAHETVTLLNDYFSLMADVILERGGLLDKYIGDAIMAVFGVPFGAADDADRAVQAAIGMLSAMGEFNGAREALGLPPVLMGVGVNSDDVVSGNIGSPKRMDYTVIGDGVNLASRLESANKTYGSQILISEMTAAELRQPYTLRELDRIVVKGKSQPVAVFEVLDHLDRDHPARSPRKLEAFARGLAAYRAREWTTALRAFDETLAVDPGDVASRLYRSRCGHFRQQPPPEDWNGAWVMTAK
jgi:adenylate cyclase